jgi:hypothetical protein
VTSSRLLLPQDRRSAIVVVEGNALPAAKEELHRHLSAVRRFPLETERGGTTSLRETWDLLGTDPLAPDMRVREERVFGWLRRVDLFPSSPLIPRNLLILRWSGM